MTEDGWLADWPDSLASAEQRIEYLSRHRRVSPRKARLCGAAFCRAVPELMAKRVARRSVELAEEYADGLVSRRVLREWRRKHSHPERFTRPWLQVRWLAWKVCVDAVQPGPLSFYVESVVHTCAWSDKPRLERYARGLHSLLVRDIFGNPFRPVTPNPAWLTPTVVSLARQMYDSRDFSPMPILADALQEAGCDNDDVLDHCRGEGPHARGCFVVGLILGKEPPR